MSEPENLLTGWAQYGAAGAAIALLTAAVGWLFRGWARVDGQSDKNYDRLERLVNAQSAEIETLKADVQELKDEREADQEKRRVNLSVMTLLIRAVQRLEHDAPELVQARGMLSTAYKLDLNTPDDMLAMLNEIGGKTRRRKG